MHITQERLLKLSKTYDFSKMSLREIGKLVGVKSPQVIKYHLLQLKKYNFKSLSIKKTSSNTFNNNPTLDDITFNLPILGSANCGVATTLAEETNGDYLIVSNSMVKRKGNLFVLRAKGDSMNQADIDGQAIEEGDYIIVDGNERTPRNGDYIVSIIEGCANIKKFFKDNLNDQILLISESTESYPEIIIHRDDFSNYMVNGIVVKVIKKPNISASN